MDLPNRMTDKGFETIPPDCQQPGDVLPAAMRFFVLPPFV